MFAFACYRIRHRRPYVIGMPERPAQLSSQQRFQAYLPPLTDRPLPYSGVPPPNTHVESIPTPRPYQRGTLVPDLEQGLSSSHNRVSSEDVRPSIHDPLLRDQSRSRSPTPVVVSEPTPPAKTYQGHESPVCNQTHEIGQWLLTHACWNIACLLPVILFVKPCIGNTLRTLPYRGSHTTAFLYYRRIFASLRVC